MTTIPGSSAGAADARPSLTTVRTGAHDGGEHANEDRMVVHGFRAREAETDRRRRGACLDVEVVQHLDMVAHEPDRHEHDVARTPGGTRTQVLVDVGAEPGLARPAAP